MKIHKPYIATLLTVIFALTSSVSSAIQFSPTELDKLAAGKTVNKPLKNSLKNGFYGGTGWTIIDASPDVVWSALQDFDSYPDVFPRTVSTKELARKNSKSVVHMALGYRILSIEYHLSIVKNPKKNMMSFTLMQNRPHDIVDTRGYWRLFPQKDGRTLVAYAVALQMPPGIVAFLGNKVEKSLEKHLIGLPRYLKKWVESPAGNRYRQLSARR